MADKKITALTALGSTDVAPASDLLHIIDYSASPVNKKITVANLFSRVDTNLSSIGATTFEIAPTTAISGFKVVVANTTPAAAAETEVVVNENSNAFVDFRVESNLSAQAIFVDASDTATGENIVFINGDSANVDFCVKGDTGVTTYTDASYDALGVGTNVLSGSYRMQVLGDGTVVDSTCDITASTALTMDNTATIAAGMAVYGVGISPGTTVASVTNATTAVLSAVSLATANNQTFTFVSAAGTGASTQFQGFVSYTNSDNIAPTSATAAVISVETPVTKVTAPASGTGSMTLAAGRDGQVKHLICIAATGGSADLDTTNVTDPNAATIVFQAAGDSWTGYYDGTLAKWLTLGGNGYAHG